MIWKRSWRVQCILYMEKIFFNTPVIKTENIVSNNYKTEKKICNRKTENDMFIIEIFVYQIISRNMRSVQLGI